MSSSAAKARILEKNDNDVVIVTAIRSALTKVGLRKPPISLRQKLIHFYDSFSRRRRAASKIPKENTSFQQFSVLPTRGLASTPRLSRILLSETFYHLVVVRALPAWLHFTLASPIPPPSILSTANARQACLLLTKLLTRFSLVKSTSALVRLTLSAFTFPQFSMLLIIGAGVESMTNGYGPGAVATNFSEDVLSCKEAEDCLIPMGITSENVATDYGITRREQDEFAATSFQRAAAAAKAGKFKDEILPIKTKVIDPKTEKQVEIIVEADDGVRGGVTADSLAKLKPAFSADGTTHAGV